jgi:hypothetical protein
MLALVILQVLLYLAPVSGQGWTSQGSPTLTGSGRFGHCTVYIPSGANQGLYVMGGAVTSDYNDVYFSNTFPYSMSRHLTAADDHAT